MNDETAIRLVLQHLTERELWLVELDVHREADAAAIGGAGEKQRMQYVSLESAISDERKRRFPSSRCPFPKACVVGWSDDEFLELVSLYRRIRRKANEISGSMVLPG